MLLPMAARSGTICKQMISITSRMLALAALALASVNLLAQQQLNKRLWVLQEPNAVVEYDPATFAPRQTQKIPHEIFKSPQDLQMNRKGQMLFLPATVHESDGLVHENTEREFWFWDGTSGRFIERQITKNTTPRAANKLLETAVPRCFLSKDGTQLFWFENRKKTLMTQDLGQEMSVNTSFHAWQTDLSGQQRQEIASQAFPPCKCETAVCSETCPEASYWSPDEGIGDFFVMTEWIPGQIGSEYHGSSFYRKADGKWMASKLPAIEKVLDSSSQGSDVALLEAIGDSGCCGWENESSDQTVLLKNRKTVTLFDEFKQYQNQDYDISFFTSNAFLSPGGGLVAFTINATQPSGTEIRLSDSGKTNPGALAQIQKTLTELPAVGVLRVEDPERPAVRIPRATLVGWINDQEILLVENDQLVAFNLVSRTRRESRIKVVKPYYAFLR
jgi:hypothetical protein